MPHITTILSDIGNVVVRFDNARTIEGIRTVTPVENRARIDHVLFGEKYGLWNLFERGLVRKEDIVSTILAALGTESSYDTHAVTLASWGDIFSPHEPVVGLWKKVRRLGLTLTAVSNAGPLRWERIERMGIEELFDHLVLSFEEGMIKQDGPEIFIRALDRSGSKAEDAFFIDDREDCLAAAASLGIRTFRYDLNDHKALEKELMLLGVPILADIPP